MLGNGDLRYTVAIEVAYDNGLESLPGPEVPGSLDGPIAVAKDMRPRTAGVESLRNQAFRSPTLSTEGRQPESRRHSEPCADLLNRGPQSSYRRQLEERPTGAVRVVTAASVACEPPFIRAQDP